MTVTAVVVRKSLNARGPQVAGFAERYNGTGTYWVNRRGSMTWPQDQTFGLNFSLRSDGYGYSTIHI